MIYRYADLNSEEGTFLSWSFWLVEALVHLGRRQEPGEVFEAPGPWSTDSGLFTEQADPDETLLGNLRRR